MDEAVELAQMRKMTQEAVDAQRQIAEENLSKLEAILSRGKVPRMSRKEPQAAVIPADGQEYLIFNTAAIGAIVEKFPAMREVIAAIVQSKRGH